MSGKLPSYKYCPVCKAKIPVQAIICLYCEESLLPDDEPEGSMYGEAVMITTVHPEAEALMEMLDGVELGSNYEEEYIRDPEDDVGEEWKREKRGR